MTRDIRCDVRHGTIWENRDGDRVVVRDTARYSVRSEWFIIYAGLSLEDRVMRPHGCRPEADFLSNFKPTGDYRMRSGRIVADQLFKETL